MVVPSLSLSLSTSLSLSAISTVFTEKRFFFSHDEKPSTRHIHTFPYRIIFLPVVDLFSSIRSHAYAIYAHLVSSFFLERSASAFEFHGFEKSDWIAASWESTGTS